MIYQDYHTRTVDLTEVEYTLHTFQSYFYYFYATIQRSSLPFAALACACGYSVGSSTVVCSNNNMIIIRYLNNNGSIKQTVPHDQVVRRSGGTYYSSVKVTLL